MVTLGVIKDFTVLSVRRKCGVQRKVIGISNVHLPQKKNHISIKNKYSELLKGRSDYESDPLIRGLTSNINEGLRKGQKMVKVQ